MATTQGDSTHGYFSPETGVSPKSVRVLSEAVCSPSKNDSLEDKEEFIKIVEYYYPTNQE
tara:strand:+ start:363 stop:542 length:180 start_codon:yes stop_codon:yes gene_type:complete